MKTKINFNFEDFHQKFSTARTNLQKEKVREEHDAFVATLSVEEHAEYLEGLTNYGKKIMRVVEAELHNLSSNTTI